MRFNPKIGGDIGVWSPFLFLIFTGAWMVGYLGWNREIRVLLGLLVGAIKYVEEGLRLWVVAREDD